MHVNCIFQSPLVLTFNLFPFCLPLVRYPIKLSRDSIFVDHCRSCSSFASCCCCCCCSFSSHFEFINQSKTRNIRKSIGDDGQWLIDSVSQSEFNQINGFGECKWETINDAMRNKYYKLLTSILRQINKTKPFFYQEKYIENNTYLCNNKNVCVCILRM